MNCTKPMTHLRLTFVALLAISTTAWGQNSNRVSAWNANKEGDYLAAVNYIELAVSHPKTKPQAKTWQYRGLIYNNIASDSSIRVMYPNALLEAIRSYQIADSLDSKNALNREIDLGFARSSELANQLAIESWNFGDYSASANHFGTATLAADLLNYTDSMAINNQALAYSRAGNHKKSAECYVKCVDIGYNPIPNLISAVDEYIALDDKDSAFELLESGRIEFPNDQGIIITEFNLYISLQHEIDEEIREIELNISKNKDISSVVEAGEIRISNLQEYKAGLFEKALGNIVSAAANDSLNAELWYTSGIVMGELGLVDESINAYNTAIGVDTAHFGANYMLASTYYNQAAKIDSQLREEFGSIMRMTKAQQAEFDALSEDMKGLFNAAKPFFERARILDPTDCDTKAALLTIYNRTGNTVAGDAIYLEMKESGCR